MVITYYIPVEGDAGVCNVGGVTSEHQPSACLWMVPEGVRRGDSERRPVSPPAAGASVGVAE